MALYAGWSTLWLTGVGGHSKSSGFGWSAIAAEDKDGLAVGNGAL